MANKKEVKVICSAASRCVNERCVHREPHSPIWYTKGEYSKSCMDLPIVCNGASERVVCIDVPSSTLIFLRKDKQNEKRGSIQKKEWENNAC